MKEEIFEVIFEGQVKVSKIEKWGRIIEVNGMLYIISRVYIYF